NISNVNTPFYSRKIVDFTEGFNGTGVNIGDVRRIYSESSSKNVQTCTSQFEVLDVYLRNLKTLEPILDNDNSNLSRYLDDAISALTVLNPNPSSYDARKSYLDKLTMLTNQFNSVNDQIQTQQQVVNQQI